MAKRKIKYKTMSINGKFTKGEAQVLRYLCHQAKSSYNIALASIKEYYEKEDKYLNRFDNFTKLQNHPISNFINAEVYQKAVFSAHDSYESYMGLLRYQKENNLETTAKEPDYLKKPLYPISFSYIGNKYENGRRYFKIPLPVKLKSIMRELWPQPKDFLKQGIDPELLGIPNDYFFKITIPQRISNAKIKEVSIVPVNNGRRFNIEFTYEDTNEYRMAAGNEVLGIDFGVNNLMTCATTNGQSFIVDGKRLKSMNQYFNKRLSYLKSTNQYVLKQVVYNNELRWQKVKRSEIKQEDIYRNITTKRMARLYTKRNNKCKDYIYKSCNMVLNHCLDNNISTVVIGYNKDFQLGGFKYPENYNALPNNVKHVIMDNIKKNNQSFIAIPFGKIKNRLEYILKLHGINVIIQEESYTSVASFFDLDEIPVYNSSDVKEYTFSGKRVERGLYISKNKIINADVNGALNIIRKSRVCDEKQISNLILRGVNTPMRYAV